MRWWPFSKKPEPPRIPKYVPPPQPPKAVEPEPEPMIVEEIRDPSESAIMRFIHKVRGEK